MHVAVETAPFIAAAKAAGLSGGDLDRVIDQLARRPDAGDVILGTGGRAQDSGRRARQRQERRLSRDHVLYGSGFSGVPADVFAKGERSDLTKAERNTLARLTKALVDSYRAGAGKLG